MSLSSGTRILLWGAGIWFFGEGLFGPLFAVFTQKIGGDILDVTWAWGIFLIVTGACYIIIGKLINLYHLDHAKMLVAGYALNTLFTFGYLLVDTPEQLLLVQAGLGVAEALGSPTWDTLYAKSIGESSAYAWGLAGGQSQIVTGIATVIGGFTVYYLSFESLFITMGIIQTVATIVQARLLFVKNTMT